MGPGLLRHDQHGHLRAQPGSHASRAHRPTVRLRQGTLPSSRDGRPLYGCVLEATGRTSGTSTSTARRTTTPSRKGRAHIGIQLRGNIWIGDEDIDDSTRSRAGVHRQQLRARARRASAELVSSERTRRPRTRADRALRHRQARTSTRRGRRGAIGRSATCTVRLQRASRSATSVDRRRASSARAFASTPQGGGVRRADPRADLGPRSRVFGRDGVRADQRRPDEMALRLGTRRDVAEAGARIGESRGTRAAA